MLGLESGDVMQVDTAITQLGKHKGSVTCISVFEGTVVSGSEDRSLVLWSDSKVNVLTGHHKAVTCVTFTPDGAKVLSGSLDQSIRVWSREDLKEIGSFHGHSRSVKCVTTTVDGRRGISGSLDGCIIVWSIDTFVEEQRISAHERMIWCLTAGESHLVSGSWDNTLKFWDINTLEELEALPGLTRDGSSVPLTPDGQYVVCASDNNELKAWKLTDPSQCVSMKGHSAPITCVAVTPKYFLSGSEDRTIRVWSSEDKQEIATLQGHSDCVTMIVVTPDYKRVVSVAEDKTARVWSVDDMKEVAALVGHMEVVTSVAVQGSTVITGAADKAVRVWDTHTMTLLAVLTGHAARINTVLLIPDGTLAVSGSKDATLRVWDLNTYEEKLIFQEHTDVIYSSILGDHCVISGSLDRTIRLWQIDTGNEMAVLRGHKEGVWSLARVNEGNMLISGSSDNDIRLWSLRAPYENLGVLAGHLNCVRCLTVAGDWLISGSSDMLIKVWSISTQRAMFSLKGHTGAICSVATTSDQQFIVSASEDCTARIWSLRDQKELLCIPCHSSCSFVTVSGRRAFLASSRLVSVINLTFELQSYRLAYLKSKVLQEPTSYQDSYSLLCANAVRLSTGQPVHKLVASHIVYPYFFNSLHVCAYFNHFDRLAQYLSEGVPILRGRYGSPLTVALERSTHKCIEVLLQYMFTCESAVLAEVTDDLPLLLQSKSLLMEAFFETLLRPAEQDSLPQFVSPRRALPIICFSPSGFVREEDFSLSNGNNIEVVEFKTSAFRWNFTIGSSESLLLLRAFEHCSDPHVLTTDLVATLIEQKWQALWGFTLGMTLLYLLLLMTLVSLQFFGTLPLKLPFVVLNLLFLGYEGVQWAVTGREYIRDTWNCLDLIRGLTSILWIVYTQDSAPVKPLQFLVVALCFIRGFTFFRTFKMTRLFVRMTIEVIKEIYSFLVILLYSTFAFGMMYAALNPEQQSLGEAWAVAYELLMGEFNNENYNWMQWLCFSASSLLNVIIMLNLLISILGDSYERAQMSAKENDLSEMLRLVIEYESMLFWRRNYGEPCVLIKCAANKAAVITDEWEGRVARMIKGVNEELFALESRVKSHIEASEARVQGQLSRVEGKLDTLMTTLGSL